MERDPVRFVWKQSRLAHAFALLVILPLIPVTWLVLSLPKDIVDQVFVASTPAPFLRTVIDLPRPFLDAPWVLFSGLPLSRFAYLMAAVALLAALIVLRMLALGGLGALRGWLARRLATRLRIALFRKIAQARTAAREETLQAAELAGRGVAEAAPFLGDALIVPLLAGIEIVLIAAFALWTEPWLGVVAVALVAAHGLAMGLYARTAIGRGLAHDAREADVARAINAAARRARAIRIHGTAAREEAGFRETLAGLDRAWRGLGRKLTLANMVRGLVREAALAAVLGIGGVFLIAGDTTPGAVVAVAFAVLALPRPAAALVEWRARRLAAQEIFDEMGRTAGALQARQRRDEAPAVLAGAQGRLVAQGLSALDPGSGVRLSGLDLALDLPAHVALVGDEASGAAVLAGLIGGAVEPSGGTLTLEGVDLSRVDPARRAGFISYAGVEPVLLDASVRDNLTYGAPAAVDDAALVAALTAAGLDADIYALGLQGSVGASASPELSAAIIAARADVRRLLADEEHADFVDPFDADAYNRHATLGENLLFGVPVGETFREANMARHPFVRAVLETEGLTGPLAEMGLSIARSMVEIFEGVPDGHPLFERFSFFSAGERGAYEELVARQSERRRGLGAQRDRDLLVALALRYVETRHRLGLLDAGLERRIVAARASFRSLLPPSLVPSVEFYDPARICTAASLADNLLFGRAAHDVAGAEARVTGVIRQVLAERGLDGAVFAVGLSTHISERESHALDARAVALDLARCLLRQPGILVATRISEGLGAGQARALLARVQAAQKGRSLFVALPDDELAQGFDTVIHFERGGLARSPAPSASVQGAQADVAP